MPPEAWAIIAWFGRLEVIRKNLPDSPDRFPKLLRSIKIRPDRYNHIVVSSDPGMKHFPKPLILGFLPYIIQAVFI
jgi:hypothetical protein